MLGQKMKRGWHYLLGRLGEPSTWGGVGLMATAAGWSVSPDHWMIISQFGMGIGGFMAAILSDKS